MNELEQRLARLSPEQREQLLKASARERTSRARIRPRSRPERIPLTFGQRRLWLQDRLDPGQVAYNSAWGMWLHGVANPVDLRRALQSLVDRHEGLRTSFPAIDGEPFQRILPQLDLPWREVRAEGADTAARRAHATRIAREDANRSFDLGSGPVLRVVLVAVESDLHLLLITFHHVAIDGWSVSTLMSEFFDAYNRLREGRALDAPAPELQIADVALWQQEHFAGERMRSQLDFWKTQLDGAPATLDLPTDRSRPATRSYRGGAWSTDLPPGVYARLQTLARECRATVSSVVLAAYQILLSRYSGQDDLVMAMGIAGRSRLELEPVVGFFINLLPLRADLSGTPTFAEYLERTHAGVLRAMEHSDAPFERIIEEQRLPRSVGYTPYAQATYFFQSYPARGESLAGLRIEDAKLQDIAPNTAQTDLQLFVNQHREGELIFEYSADLYDEATIRRMSGHLVTLLTAVADAPQTPIALLPLLTVDECLAIDRWNATDRDLPADPTIAALFAAQAAATPDAVAIRFGGREMTYAELDQRADAVAVALRQAGAKPGILVGLYVERTLEMLVGLVGIVKAGAAYVPLDPGFPRDRLAYMVETSQSTIIVTQASLRDQLPAPVPSVIVVDADAPVTPGESMRGCGVGADDPAYVIFTSGSTGKPKGVEIRQKAAVNLIRSIAREPGIAAGDTICAISTLSFDIALTELVIPLTVGACILLVDRDTVRDGLRLRRLVETEPLTLMQATPATWRMLLDVGWPGKPSMRIISTGEALPRELADRLLPMGRELWNLYGPTETTVYSALCRVEPGTGPIIVGRPVDNTRIHIVDRQMQPLPVGVPGELLIGGDGLAAGYRGRPDLTAEKFIPDPFSAEAEARLYRTGDLAFWRADGTVQVVGRIDHQIKLRGFRIELGEIESVLGDYPGLDQVVVHCREDLPGEPRLVAYYSCLGVRPDPAELRTFLKSALPEYMVPSAFVALDAFPLTPNGKVDRRALPAPDIAAGADDDFVGPRNDDEQALAALWSELLRLPKIDVRADFFAIGGHSLLATRLLARIEYDHGIELPLRALFEAPTVEQLAVRIAHECEAADRAALAALLDDVEGMSEAELQDRLSAAGTIGAV